LAAVDIKTAELKRWAPKVAPAKKEFETAVLAMQPSADGTTIYVGGSFGHLGHKSRSNLGALDAKSGSVRRWHPAVNDSVSALAIDPRGRSIYAGGDFTKVDGLERAGLAAFDLRRGVATRWNPDCDGSISQIVPAPGGSPVYVAGEFASIGQKSRRGIAALERTRGAATSWDPNVAGSVDAILLSSSKHTIYIGGEFDSVGDADRSNLAGVNTKTGVATSWNPQTIGTVSVLAHMRGGALAVGGELSSVGAVSRSRLALFGLDGALSNWAPQLGGTAVRAIAASPDGARASLHRGPLHAQPRRRQPRRGQYDHAGNQPVGAADQLGRLGDRAISGRSDRLRGRCLYLVGRPGAKTARRVRRERHAHKLAVACQRARQSARSVGRPALGRRGVRLDRRQVTEVPGRARRCRRCDHALGSKP
jgi:hypothetical protein